MKHIMAAIDGSEPSYRALEHAATLAKAVGAQLSILIIREFIVSRKGIYDFLTEEEVKAIQDKAREIVLAAGDPARNFILEKSRDAAFKIVDVAIDKGADLIVMGASGKGGFKSFLIGSVSQEVLRKSACPVTIVH
ncbi:universal stress protein [Hoeflea sp. YIM 152468]|uniref:universal stress protein n=1 Tax=Hoeflea sp. YIM 152468 TaxID=3031759 RepID=UPI0023D9AE3A|nr:universal stress protein [Hoeflea sp. YIM 152468]MDF1609333.1 universal stress protein [Hoeflea sp. YIM 152468]